jgi:hypothetical protein
MCGSFPGLLIGRTAVHSGKDPAFAAYDQFLSTGILQPLSRGEVRCGVKMRKTRNEHMSTGLPREPTLLGAVGTAEKCHSIKTGLVPGGRLCRTKSHPAAQQRIGTHRNAGRTRSARCARAASGHTTAAPPSSVMNSRRLLIRSPRRRSRAAQKEW